jgi:hypothetical protein
MDTTDYPDEDRQAVAGYLRDRARRMNCHYQEHQVELIRRRAELLERLAAEVEPEGGAG